MSHRPGRRQAAGFSIIELAITIAVLAVLVGLAIPSIRMFLANYRATAQANDLLADLAFARTEAAKLGRTVQVVANGGNWTTGWIVGADLDASGAISATETFRQHGAAEDGFRIIEGGGLASFGFDPTGALNPSTLAQVELAICQPTGEGFNRHRAVIVNRIGRAELSKWNAVASAFPASNVVAVTCPP